MKYNMKTSVVIVQKFSLSVSFRSAMLKTLSDMIMLVRPWMPHTSATVGNLMLRVLLPQWWVHTYSHQQQCCQFSEVVVCWRSLAMCPGINAGFPHLLENPGKSRILFLKSPRPGKSLKMNLVLESAGSRGICLWFTLTTAAEKLLHVQNTTCK